MQPPADATNRKQFLQIARIIASAMLIGCVTFWAIAFVMKGKHPANTSLPESTLFAIWAALGLPGLAGALFFKARATAIGENKSANLDRAQLGQVQSNLIVAWALLESAALFAGVAMLTFGAEKVLYAAIPVYLIGFAMTFPQAEWFGA